MKREINENRPAEGMIEGRNAVNEALRAGRAINKVFYAKGGGAQKKETRATARTGAKAEKNADTQ